MRALTSRILFLIVVFIVAFLVVAGLRFARDGGDFSRIFSSKTSQGTFQSEKYTLTNKPSIDPSSVEILAAINAESASLVRSVVPSVVSIDTTSVRHERFRDIWGRTWVQPRAIQGQGSGVIVTKEGHVLTNHHVIDGSPRIRITMHDGSVKSARVIGSDAGVDIAVLKIDDKGPFSPLPFGDSTKAEVGNTVFSIGNPFGLGTSVTDGKLSAKKRPFSDSQVDLLQTSAPINPGNSGGPLINVKGEIIGINSRIYSTDKKNPGFQGIGFAIPSNAALKAMKDILAKGRPIRGFLGIALRDLDGYTSKQLGYPFKKGLYVSAVLHNSPASKAGLEAGDILISFNGQIATNPRHIINQIQLSSPGKKVTLDIWRLGKKLSMTTRIGDAEDYNNPSLEAPTINKEEAALSTTTNPFVDKLGLFVRNPLEHESKGGIIITRITPQSPLRNKLIAGDRIVSINGKLLSNVSDFFKLLSVSVTSQNTQMLVLRHNTPFFLTFPPLQ